MKKIIQFSLLFLFSISFVAVLYSIVLQKKLSGFNSIANLPKVFNRFLNFGQKTTLETDIEHIISISPATFAISIKSLRNGESYYNNEHMAFESASLYKLWVMATVYDQIEKGTIKEEDVLIQEISVLNEKFQIATQSAEKKEGEIKLSVQNALSDMITVSDNYAALLLSEKIGLSTVSAFLKNNGFSESFLGDPPKTTAYDMTLFFEKLYKKQLVSKTSSEKMINLLLEQKLTNKLPKYLSNIPIAHKTGEIGVYSHDAGIVFLDNNDYIIVILTKSNSPLDTNEQIARVSEIVYTYFKQ